MSQSTGDDRSQGNGIKKYITDNKITSSLFVTRMFTIICGICAVVPLFSGSTHPSVWYFRAHMAAVLTSALRLTELIQADNQPLSLSRATLTSLMSKDACHYLIFSVMFLSATPIIISIIPIILFAILHSCSFLNKMMLISSVNLGLLKLLIDKITSNQVFLLQVLAINEIMLMPIIIMTILSGGGNLFLPFVYYRFICLRYTSTRNPYTRTVFLHLRMSVEHIAAHGSCPSVISTVLLKARDLVSRLCPQQ